MNRVERYLPLFLVLTLLCAPVAAWACVPQSAGGMENAARIIVNRVPPSFLALGSRAAV